MSAENAAHRAPLPPESDFPSDLEPEVGDSPVVPDSARNPLALWILRLLVRGRLLRRLVERDRMPLTDILQAAGLPSHGPTRSLPALQRLAGRWLVEVEAGAVPHEGSLWRNVAWLGERLGLSRTEQQILAFAIVVKTEDGLQDCFKGAGVLTVGRVSELVGHMLDVPGATVAAALLPGGALRSLRLLTTGGPRHNFVHDKIPIAVVDAIDEILLGDHGSADALFARFFTPAGAPVHALDEFPHLGADLRVLVPLLRSAVAERAPGVNVLIYGAPGTGKTQLARAAAAAAGASLVQISVADEDDDPATGKRRMTSYAICQRFLRHAPGCAVLFDEMEDAFPRAYSDRGGLKLESSPTKGWTNQMLEENPVPAIWIGNHVDQIDPAFIRRFDLAFEVREPPPDIRARMLRRHTTDLAVTEGWVEARSKDVRVRPGHIERAVRVARLVRPGDAPATEGLLCHVMDRTLAAEGAGGRPGATLADGSRYDLALLNASVDLERVIQGLARKRTGTLCLHGPPGTGKTAFVAHLAARLGAPLLARSASELLGMYVGQTEQNLARMFREAEAQGAILFLDEADGFLQDRSRAVRSWEVTQVNELLVGIERFPGIFACATNLMDALDQAVFRRFAIKIRFDPLGADQRWRMLLGTLESLGTAAPEGDAGRQVRAALDRLDLLTPGDFAAVARRAGILGGQADAGAIVRDLGEECRVKQGGRSRKMGFT